MRAPFSITKSDCNILITGDYGEGNPPYSQSVTVNILVKDDTIINHCLVLHTGIDEALFTLPSDGLYTVYHIIVPTVEWLNERKDDLKFLYKYKNIYVASGYTILRYDFREESYSEVGAHELLYTNSNVITEYQDVFSTTELEECLRSKLDFSESCEVEEKESTYKRDITNIFLDIIKYYAECGDYKTALSYLDKFNNCYQFCGEDNQYCYCNGNHNYGI